MVSPERRNSAQCAETGQTDSGGEGTAGLGVGMGMGRRHLGEMTLRHRNDFPYLHPASPFHPWELGVNI